MLPKGRNMDPSGGIPPTWATLPPVTVLEAAVFFCLEVAAIFPLSPMVKGSESIVQLPDES
jgi:hypothetical protein